MPDDVSFRRAVASDALCIGVLGMQVFLDTYATDGIRPSLAREVLEQFDTAAVASLLADARARCIVAERNGHLIGFAQASLHEAHPAIVSARPAKLDRLYVQEPFVGIGVGLALLGRIEALAAADGADLLWLTSWIGNARALAFYPRRGYDDVGPTIYAFEGEEHENRLFAKTLRSAG